MLPIHLLISLWLAQASSPEMTATDVPQRIQSQMFDLEYDVNEAALPLSAVKLWYSLDGGASWRFYGEDEDRHPPFAFLAPQEGEFGFYLVMVNGSGSSGPQPAANTKPQLSAFVDFSAPVVQLHPPTQTTALSQRVLQIRWTAVDANFPARPIQIAYQSPAGSEWRYVSPDPIANTGRLDWRVPTEINGSLALRITATDRGGFRSESEIVSVDLATKVETQAQPIVSPVKESSSEVKLAAMPMPVDAAESGRAQAVRLYAEALAHRDRGEYRQAVARLRDVVRLDPEGVEAMQEMAALLYMSGDYERSHDAYNLVLARQPMNRAAILGAARVHRQRQEYESAAEKLRSLLRYNPGDAEAWMALGDIGVYKGDEILARECYTRAMHAKSGDAAVVEDARQRLSLMTEAGRVVK